MSRGSRGTEDYGGGTGRRKRTKKTREVIGLTPYSRGRGPSAGVKARRVRQAEEAGYSDFEIEIIRDAPFKLATWRWKEVRLDRKDRMLEYCKIAGHRIPTPKNWKDYRTGEAPWEVLTIINSWKEAAKRIDAMYGHQTIFDIFYEGVHE